MILSAIQTPHEVALILLNYYYSASIYKFSLSPHFSERIVETATPLLSRLTPPSDTSEELNDSYYNNSNHNNRNDCNNKHHNDDDDDCCETNVFSCVFHAISDSPAGISWRRLRRRHRGREHASTAPATAAGTRPPPSRASLPPPPWSPWSVDRRGCGGEEFEGADEGRYVQWCCAMVRGLIKWSRFYVTEYISRPLPHLLLRNKSGRRILSSPILCPTTTTANP